MPDRVIVVYPLTKKEKLRLLEAKGGGTKIFLKREEKTEDKLTPSPFEKNSLLR